MNNISAVLAGFLLVIATIMGLQIVELNKEVSFLQTSFNLEVQKEIQCQANLVGATINK